MKIFSNLRQPLILSLQSQSDYDNHNSFKHYPQRIFAYYYGPKPLSVPKRRLFEFRDSISRLAAFQAASIPITFAGSERQVHRDSALVA